MIDYAMTDEVYHTRPELSSTGARSLLPEFDGSPAKFQWMQGREFNTPAFDIGHAVHAKVLGTGLQAVAYPEELLASNGAASTKAAKEWAEDARANGMVPMKAVEVHVINKIVEAVMSNPDARKVLELPHRETSIFNVSPEGIPVRARFDVYGNGAAADLKTTLDASPRGFARSVVKYGYYMQEAWYRDVHRWETGLELEKFKFIAVQTTGPYQVAVHELDAEFRQIGFKLAETARETYARCRETGMWPGVPGEILSPPNWLAYEYEEDIA